MNATYRSGVSRWFNNNRACVWQPPLWPPVYYAQIGLCARLPLVSNAVSSILARSHTDPRDYGGTV